MKPNKFCKEVNFNRLIILDCISENESQTAKHLHDNLIDKNFNVDICYRKVINARSFCAKIQEIKMLSNPELRSAPLLPIIHIEAHGCSRSMELADKSTIPWEKLVNDLREINKFMRNQLVTFIGTCHGYHFIYNKHTIKKFAPAFFCIAPLEEISAGAVEVASSAFYENLFKTGDLTKSASLLDPAKIYTYNSESNFFRSFLLMLETKRGKALKQRNEDLLTQAIQLGFACRRENMNSNKQGISLGEARYYIKESYRNKELLKQKFEIYSIRYLGYVNENWFEEIWESMKENKRGEI